ncbi:MAG: peptidoglycan editing factor PgeF [Acidobacteriota bacterium]
MDENCRIDRKNDSHFLYFPLLERMPHVRHVLFLNHSRLYPGKDRALRNCLSEEDLSGGELLKALDLPASALVSLQQVHGKRCIAVSERNASLVQSSEGDCLITSEKGIAIAVHTADCFPVMIVDAEAKAVACIHAGWRGIASGIIEVALERMMEVYSCRMNEMVVTIGPGIEKCCYTVREDLLDAFQKQGVALERFITGDGDRSFRLSLREIIQDKLQRSGVKHHEIHHTGLCTCCSPLNLPSYRRDGMAAGCILSAIMLL